MTLKLYQHPLASYCWKVLIALYENGTDFEPVLVDLGDPESRAAFEAVWPLAKMPALRDEARGCTVAESTVVVEYLDTNYPGAAALIPRDADAAWRVRMWDRLFDNHVQGPLQTIVFERLRPPGNADPFGVEQARAQLAAVYGVMDRMLGGTWATGDGFTLADCSAAPALFYADLVVPLAPHRKLSAYLDRLMSRPSVARVLREAEPYFHYFPMDRKPRLVRGSV
ncbi:MAG: glutathione S-transferase family protein [Hyphomicrobiales bacterium]